MSPLQVTFSSDVFAQRVGGVSRYFGQLIRDLPQFGIDARAAAGFHNNQYLRLLPQKAVQGFRVPIEHARLASHLFPVVNRISEPAWAPRSGIFHPTYYTAGVPRRQMPIVVTVYDMIHERMPQYFSVGDPTPRQKANWVRRADAVIAISESTRRDLVDILGLPSNQVTVIHPGIEPPSPELGVERSGDVVLYVGHRSGYKNWSTVVKALALNELSGLRLLCFGGPPPRREELALLDRFHLLDRTRFESGSDASLSGWYRRAAVLVYSSLYEGYGYPPLEAVAHGCPVVCGRNSSLVETMRGLAAFVDDPLAADALGEAILRAVGTTMPKNILVPTCQEAARRHADLYRGI